MFVSGIPSARRKLARAQMHAETLRADVDTFRERSPYKFDTSASHNTPGTRDVELIYRVASAPPIPDSWALITGDVLTNANAALDHAVFRHVRQHAPHVPSHRIQFPITESSADFEGKAAWFEPGVAHLIEAAQPYRWRNPAAHPLRMLRKLVNADKHRELVVASYVMDAFVVASSDLYEVVSTDVGGDEDMAVGAVVARAHLRVAEHATDRDYLDVACNPVFGESIEVPDIVGRVDLVVAVDRVIARIGPYLDALEAAGC